MAYKFEGLKVWQTALEYDDLTTALARGLPREERFDLADQWRRARTSISTNIGESSTSQSSRRQAYYLSIAIGSVIETVVCLHLMRRRGYVRDEELWQQTYALSEKLFAQLQALRSSIVRPSHRKRPR